jgi:hypothetical protein
MATELLLRPTPVFLSGQTTGDTRLGRGGLLGRPPAEGTCRTPGAVAGAVSVA